MRHRVGHNALVNVVGVVLPSLVGVVALRFLLDALGQAAMGVFTLALGLVGISGILDFGLSRGITRYVAHATAADSEWRRIAPVMARCVALLCLIGAVVGALIWFGVPRLTHWLRCEDASLCEEAISGFRWVGFSIPFALMSSGILSMLEGRQQFLRVNLVKIPVGFLVFILPAVVATYSHSLSWALLSLAAVRVFGFGLSFAMAPFTVREGMGQAPHGELGHLLKFSGWLSVSNVISPFLVYGDRFYLAATVPSSAIALYTVPFDAAYRGTALPLAGLNAVFPELARAGALGDSRVGLFARARKMLLLFWLCPVVVACLLGKELLALWLGTGFADQGWRLFQVVLCGVCFNGLSHLVAAMLHADGRSDLTAKFHIAELLPYGALVLLLVGWLGVIGAAIAWSCRVLADFLLLCAAVWWRRIIDRREMAKFVLPGVLLVAAGLGVGQLATLVLRAGLALVVFGVTTLMLWDMFRSGVLGRAVKVGT